ncbi:MAG: ribonuclease III domain-containing protein [Oscillospiraceae bacterium]
MSDTTFAKRKSPVELAFIGDAVFEVLVREHITRNVDTSANKLHRMAVSYVCAEAQSEALEQIAGDLTAEELDIVRRGKNASKVSVPRNGTPRTYRSSTAFEALFGYLYLSGETERIDQLFEKIKSFHTDKE